MLIKTYLEYTFYWGTASLQGSAEVNTPSVGEQPQCYASWHSRSWVFSSVLNCAWSVWPIGYFVGDIVWLPRLGHKKYGGFHLGLRISHSGRRQQKSARTLRQPFVEGRLCQHQPASSLSVSPREWNLLPLSRPQVTQVSGFKPSS